MEGKNRGWLTVLYPESMAMDWKDRLNEVGQQFIRSPLHDKDFNATGERKKPHYHLLLLWDGPTTYSKALKVVTLIKGVGCLPCATIRGSVRYFSHLDNPEKAQYCYKDMIQSGGLDLEKFILSESDELQMLGDMMDHIRIYNFESYAQFVDYCRMNNWSWYKLIMNKYRENIFKYLRSIEYDNKKEILEMTREF